MKRWIALAWVVLAGCTVGPNHEAPRNPLPAAYPVAERAPVAATGVAPAADPAQWWTAFGDARLTELVRRAATNNADVRRAAARVRAARALRGVAAADQGPQVDAHGAAARAGQSRHSLLGGQLAAQGRPEENSLLDAGFDLRWEIDVFGGRRRASEGAAARADAGVEEGREVLLSVLAEVGLTYLDWQAAGEELRVARAAQATQAEFSRLMQARAAAGLTSGIATAAALAGEAAAAAPVPPWIEAQAAARHRLSVLLAADETEWSGLLDGPSEIAAPPPRVPLGLPAELLRQRPDIRRAERLLAAANADIGVARADLFPKFYLTGGLARQSIEARDFFSGGSRYWSLGPGVDWPIFTVGRIRETIRARTARQEETALLYEGTVRAAFAEVRDALVAFGQEQDQLQARRAEQAARQTALDLARDREHGGVGDHLEVLAAESALLAAEAEAIAGRQLLSRNYIRLAKALGGGWSPEPVAAATP